MESRQKSKLKVIKTTIKAVAENGMDDIKMRSLQGDVGVSRTYLYNMFENKKDILYECFLYIDTQIEELFKKPTLLKNLSTMTPQQQLRCMWAIFYRYLITHPDETIFYYNYMSSKTFLNDIGIEEISSFKSFSRIIKLYRDYSPEVGDADDNILYLHLLIGTVMYAHSVAVGVIKDTKFAEQVILSMIEAGLNKYFGILPEN